MIYNLANVGEGTEGPEQTVSKGGEKRLAPSPHP